MDGLTIYGLLSVLLMLVFYALESRSAWCVLAFAVSCVMASICGFWLSRRHLVLSRSQALVAQAFR